MPTEQFQNLLLQKLDDLTEEQRSIKNNITKIQDNLTEVQKELTKVRVDLTEVKTDLKNHIELHKTLRSARAERWKVAGIIGAILLGLISLISQAI